MEKIETMKCPVCGKLPDVWSDWEGDRWFARCKCSRGATGTSEAELAEAWNDVCRQFLKKDRAQNWGVYDS